jgi:DNA (cytosine-5)-methyltransferase 1
MIPTPRFVAVDFFCGAGGLTRGLLDSGIQVCLGIDKDERCKKTYEDNNAPSKFMTCDIAAVSCEDLAQHIGTVRSENLVFVACAPCQPFAQLNRMRNSVREARLLGAFERLVRHFMPAFVFLENVPGLARVKGRSTLARFRAMLRSQGYNFAEGIVDAKWYGVPQTRRRFVLLASKTSSVALPPKTHGIEGSPYRTVKEFIGHFPPIGAGESHPSVPNHVAAIVSAKNLNRLQHTPNDGGSRANWPKKLVLDCHKAHGEAHSDSYGRMRWEQPAPTLTCRCHSISNGRYGHPEQNRALSLREAASLQTFPDTYVFTDEARRHIAAQVGNAVPVKLAEAVGKQILALSRSANAQTVSQRKRPG